MLGARFLIGQSALQEPPPCSQTTKSYPETQCLNDLANYYSEHGKHDDEVLILKRLVSTRKKAPGVGKLDLATTLRRLGYAFISAGRHPEAEPVLKRALDIQERALGQNDREVSNTLRLLGMAYYYQGRDADAESNFVRALTIRQKVLPPGNPGYPDVAESFDDLGSLYKSEEKFDKAEESFKRALTITEEGPQGPNSYLIARSLDHLGRLYTLQARYKEAEPLLQRAMKITEAWSNAETVNVLQDYAALLEQTNRAAEAQDLRTHAQAILGKQRE